MASVWPVLPGQHAAGAGTQREDMAWMMQIRRSAPSAMAASDGGGDAVMAETP